MNDGERYIILPLLIQLGEGPDTKSRRSHRSKNTSFYKTANFSEGEQSGDEDDVEILSTGKRSNLTNTSVRKVVVAKNETSS